MKNIAPYLLLTLSFSAFAIPPMQIDRSCREFDQRMERAEQDLINYDANADYQNKLDKMQNIESRIQERQNLLNGYQAQISALQMDIQNLQRSMVPATVDMGNINRIQAIDAQINNKENLSRIAATNASRTSDFSQKREFLRQSNLLQVEIRQLRMERERLNAQVEAARIQEQSRMQMLTMQLSQKNAQLMQTTEALKMADARPSLDAMMQVREEMQQDLNNISAGHEDLQKKLERAKYHVEMCNGYQELSVKYPVALETARRISREGCQNYRPLPSNGPVPSDINFVTDAQNDVFRKMCQGGQR